MGLRGFLGHRAIYISICYLNRAADTYWVGRRRRRQRRDDVNSERAFSDESMGRPGVHIRVAYADNTRWVSVYQLDKMPAGIEALIQDTKALARQVMQEQSKESSGGDGAQAYLKPENNTARKDYAQIIIKVKIFQSGKIPVNQKGVSLTELAFVLDDLQKKKEAVWYYR